MLKNRGGKYKVQTRANVRFLTLDAICIYDKAIRLCYNKSKAGWKGFGQSS